MIVYDVNDIINVEVNKSLVLFNTNSLSNDLIKHACFNIIKHLNNLPKSDDKIFILSCIPSLSWKTKYLKEFETMHYTYSSSLSISDIALNRIIDSICKYIHKNKFNVLSHSNVSSEELKFVLKDYDYFIDFVKYDIPRRIITDNNDNIHYVQKMPLYLIQEIIKDYTQYE